jgi:asparagine synthase (glutamine-hydrolysing)
MFESRRQLPNQYVMKVDKASMAESIEARAPFLDRRIAEIAYNTPREWLIRGGENKYLLRAMARSEQLLPETVAQRPKYGAPLAADWMDRNAGFRSFARDKILGGTWARRAGLEKAMVTYFSGKAEGFRAPHPISIFRILAWRLLLIELWSPVANRERA